MKLGGQQGSREQGSSPPDELCRQRGRWSRSNWLKMANARPRSSGFRTKTKRVSPKLREENVKEINTDAQFWHRPNAVVVEHGAVVWHVTSFSLAAWRPVPMSEACCAQTLESLAGRQLGCGGNHPTMLFSLKSQPQATMGVRPLLGETMVLSLIPTLPKVPIKEKKMVTKQHHPQKIS